MNRVFRALSDPTRRGVLQLLRAGPMTAGELAECFDVSKPTMSAHFAVLQDADLIEAERQGRSIVYRLQLSVLEDALLAFADTVGLRDRMVRAPRRSAASPQPLRVPRGAQ